MRARRWHLRTFRVPARRVPSEPSSPYSPSNGTIEMSAPPNAFCSTRDHFCGSSPNHAAPSLCISCTTGVVPHVGVTRIISMGAPSIAHRSDPGRAYPGARRAEYSQSGMARCRSKRQKEQGRPPDLFMQRCSRLISSAAPSGCTSMLDRLSSASPSAPLAVRGSHAGILSAAQEWVKDVTGGEGGIRTHEPAFGRLPAFEAGSFNRSDTSPRRLWQIDVASLTKAGRRHNFIACKPKEP